MANKFNGMVGVIIIMAIFCGESTANSHDSCPSGEYYDTVQKRCVNRVRVDKTCNDDGQCVPYATCQDYEELNYSKCECIVGFVRNSTGWCDIKFGGECPKPNAQCDTFGNYSCISGKCLTGSQDKNESLPVVGVFCATDSDCSKGWICNLQNVTTNSSTNNSTNNSTNSFTNSSTNSSTSSSSKNICVPLHVNTNTTNTTNSSSKDSRVQADLSTVFFIGSTILLFNGHAD